MSDGRLALERCDEWRAAEDLPKSGSLPWAWEQRCQVVDRDEGRRVPIAERGAAPSASRNSGASLSIIIESVVDRDEGVSGPIAGAASQT